MLGQRSIPLVRECLNVELFALALLGPVYRWPAIRGRLGSPLLVCLASTRNQVFCQVLSCSMEGLRGFTRGIGKSHSRLGMGECKSVSASR
jgi:hypothetical protein